MPAQRTKPQAEIQAASSSSSAAWAPLPESKRAIENIDRVPAQKDVAQKHIISGFGSSPEMLLLTFFVHGFKCSGTQGFIKLFWP